jgi:hypothetical protein
MGGAYAFSKAVSANLREKDDSWNTAIGGFFGGSIIGLRCEQEALQSRGHERRLIFRAVRTTPAFFGYGAGLSVLMGAFDYCGGRFSGYKKDPTLDEVNRKTELRKNRRKSIEETVAELGEGRGMYLGRPTL